MTGWNACSNRWEPNLESGIATWINPESYDPAKWGALWAEQKEKADAIQVGVRQLPDRVMLAVYNAGDGAKDAVLKVDLDARGLTPKLVWQEFVGVRELHAEGGARAPELDYYGGTLILRGLPAGGGRLVAIRRY